MHPNARNGKCVLDTVVLPELETGLKNEKMKTMTVSELMYESTADFDI